MKPKEITHSLSIAIIGIGCMFPQAKDLNTYWANILGKVDAITEVPSTHWSPEDYYHQDPKKPDHTYGNRGGFLSPTDFDPLEYGILPNALEATDTSQLLGLMVAKEALEDAGYGPDRPFDPRRVSVILGVTGALELVIPLGARLGHPRWRKALLEAGIEETLAEEVVERIGDSYVGWQEGSFPGLLGNVVAGRIANYFNLGGTNCVVDAACASSMGALHMAAMELSSGNADMVLAGGLDTFNDIFMYMCFSKTPALSPTGNARPFDSQADGTILGEGVGILVLKRLEDANRDGDRIYAVLQGIGSSSDGKGQAIYAPSHRGQARAIEKAYQQAGITSDTIEMVEAHGTGTKVGDATEFKGLLSVYSSDKEREPWCALGSVKSQIGHTKAAAGIAGIIKTALALHHQVLPPTIKVEKPLPEVQEKSPFYINTEKRPWFSSKSHLRRGAVSAFGFGGSNFHCLLEEHPQENRSPHWDGRVQIIPLSADHVDGLKASLLSLWQKKLSWEEIRLQAAGARKAFQPEQACRVVLVVEEGGAELSHLLSTAQKMLDQYPPKKTWTHPLGIYFSQEKKPGKVAFLFPGQGAQYTGMSLDLACQFPQLQEVLSEANQCYSEGEKSPTQKLSDFIYPLPSFDEESKEAKEDLLRSTQRAQPAIGAVSLGSAKILETFGLIPESLAGHSYGELTALCLSHRLSPQDFHHLSRIRGELMAQAGANGKGDAGSMLAVQAPLARVEKVITQENLQLVVANKNAPNQAVLSGATAEIERAGRVFTKENIHSKQLSVSAAFHSPLVEEAQGPFLSELEKVEFSPGKIPVFANSTAEEYPQDPSAARKILAGQLAHPVEFLRLIEGLYSAQVRTFVEVGPGSKLSGLVKAILGDLEHSALALDSSSGSRSGQVDLARLLSQIASLGYSLNLDLWDPKGGKKGTSQKKSKMSVQLCGANYRSSQPQKKLSSLPKAPGALPMNSPGTNGSEKKISSPPKDTGGIPQRAPVKQLPSPSEKAPSTPFLSEALRITQENILALGKIQEQTARLHRQYLEGQEKSQQTFLSLIEQQQSLLNFSMSGATEIDPPSFPTLSPALSPGPLKKPTPLRSGGNNGSSLGTPGPVSLSTPPVREEKPLKKAPPQDRQIEKALLEIVAEKTGYPAPMLELSMELEGDLGIDSIKRVEIFSALQEKLPGSRPVKSEDLGALRSLSQIVEFLSSPSLPVPLSPAPPEKESSSPLSEGIERKTLSLREVISSDRQSFTTPPGAEIWIAGEDSPLSKGLQKNLESRSLSASLVSLKDLPSLKIPPQLGGLIILAPSREVEEDFLKRAFLLTQMAGPSLKEGAKRGGAFLIGLSKLDGAFGLTSAIQEGYPLTGGLAGLVKTAHLEWTEIHCKALDISPSAEKKASLDKLIEGLTEEIFRVGPLEVGLTEGKAFTLELNSDPLPPQGSSTSLPLEEGDLVVITGGARGVTAEVARVLAGACKPRLILLGRSELAEEPAWLLPLREEGEIKKALLTHYNGKATPQIIEREYKKIFSHREILRNLKAMESLGALVEYRSVDVRDASALQALFQELQRDFGPVRGLIHGAGVIEDRRIEDKTEEQFDLVYSTKVLGLQALLKATDLSTLNFMVFFSSSTGRFGRVGQVDYAIANEVLNKLAQFHARSLPGCRVISVGWGPWEGGMVTPAIRKIFEKEGVPLIPLKAGAQYLLKELSSPARPAEVVILGGPSKQDQPPKNPATPAQTKMTLSFKLDLGIENFPFLKSHVIKNSAVLPAAMMVEWMAQGALHTNPGLKFYGFDHFRVLKGVVLKNSQPYPLSLMVGKASKEGKIFRVAVELRGPGSSGEVIHSKGEFLLSSTLPAEEPSLFSLPLEPYDKSKTEIYETFLFHGADFQSLERVEGCSEKAIQALCQTSPSPEKWMTSPFRKNWISDPLSLDGSFQMMILWTFENYQVGSLPCYIGKYRQFQSSFPPQIRISMEIKKHHSLQALSQAEFITLEGGLLARMEDCECTLNGSLKEDFRKNSLPV